MGETRGSRGENGRYHANFRQKERETILRWIRAGASGSVVGLAGAGKSNLIRYLCHHLDMDTVQGMGGRLVSIVSVDLHDLPDWQLPTLYRTILRGIYEGRERFGRGLQEIVSERYQQHLTITDSFVLQSALRGLLLHLQERHVQLVLVLDRFDDFCSSVDPDLVNNLKGLRDSFKDTLYFLVGMRKEPAYLTAGVLGELYELVDSQTCWVGPMSLKDASYMLAQLAKQAGRNISEEALAELYRLTGGYPSLVRVASDWWRLNGDAKPMVEWQDVLLYLPSIEHRLQEIWECLPGDDQDVIVVVEMVWGRETAVLVDKESKTTTSKRLQGQQRYLLERLVDKGLVIETAEQQWELFSPLFSQYVRAIMQQGRDAVWQDENTGLIYQGQRCLHLAPLEHSLMVFFLANPEVVHSRNQLISKMWPDDKGQDTGLREDGLYQLIAGLRRRIEPFRKDHRYIVTVHKRGYQFFPNGQPDGES